MKNILYKKNNQFGATAIFITLIILGAMLFVTLTVNTIVVNGISMSRAHLNSTKAYFAAESGTERILWRIRQQPAPALNPFDFGWQNNKCVDFNPPADTCSLDCNVNPTAPSKLYDPLTNLSKYKIEFFGEWNVPVIGKNTATFKSTGEYLEITKRVVQVKYQFE